VAAAADLPLSWRGLYYYPQTSDNAPVPFELNLTSVNGDNFEGRTTEPATFGDKPCTNLYANISGQVKDNKIDFIKTYDGTCGQSHSVRYSGTLSGDNISIEGTWTINEEWGGAFTAKAK
jgi:hypothetical protein